MRLKRKVLERNRNAQREAPSIGSAPPPFEASVLAPRTKWRAIVLPKQNSSANVNQPHEAATNSHDALVSGLFHGTDENENYNNDSVSDDSGGGKRRRLGW